MTWQDLDKVNIEQIKDDYRKYITDHFKGYYSHIAPQSFENFLLDYSKCEICGEWNQELTDTTTYINGGCGMCCESCIEDGEMVEI